MKTKTNRSIKKPLKLFVWEKVFSDWTDGVAFALAASADAARRLIAESVADADIAALRFPPDEGFRERSIKSTLEELAEEPKEYQSPYGFRVCGGG